MGTMSRSNIALVFVAATAFGIGWGANTLFLKERAVVSIEGIVHPNSRATTLILANDPGKTVDFGQFWNTWAALEDRFAPASTSSLPSQEARVEAAIRGLAQSYGDPYTVFLPKKAAEALKENVRGDFEGIGAILSGEAGITVQEVLPGSPAETSGVRRNDRIIAIDGVPVLGLSLEAAIQRIRGPAGSSVALTILRETNEQELTIMRGKILIPTVAAASVSRMERVASAVAGAVQGALKDAAKQMAGAAEAVHEEERAYHLVKLVSFSGSSIEQFAREMKNFAESGERALIIDVRDNPGGDLAVAAELASHFLPKDAVVATVRGRTPGEEEVYRSRGYETLGTKREACVAVVVNGNSASASEIFAAALAEHGAGKTVGVKTFGKGSVQQLVEVGDLGTLKITIAHWYTPHGISISHEGFTPEIAPTTTLSTLPTGDPFLDTAIDVCAG